MEWSQQYCNCSRPFFNQLDQKPNSAKRGRFLQFHLKVKDVTTPYNRGSMRELPIFGLNTSSVISGTVRMREKEINIRCMQDDKINIWIDPYLNPNKTTDIETL